MRRLPQLRSVLIASLLSLGLGQQGCDGPCQYRQRQALVSIYSATGGPNWKATSVLVTDPAGWPDSASEAGLPDHCSWSGMPYPSSAPGAV